MKKVPVSNNYSEHQINYSRQTSRDSKEEIEEVTAIFDNMLKLAPPEQESPPKTKLNRDLYTSEETLIPCEEEGTYILGEKKPNFNPRIDRTKVRKLIISAKKTQITKHTFYDFDNLEEVECLADHVTIAAYAFPPYNKIKVIKGKNMSISKFAFSEENDKKHYMIYEDTIKYYGFNLRIDQYYDYNNLCLDAFEINNQALYNYLYYKDPYARMIMTKILQNFPEDKLMSDLITKYDEEAFLKNLELLNGVRRIFYRPELITDENIIKIFINNPNLFQYSIEDCLLANYTYLVAQSSIPEEKLQELYFGKMRNVHLQDTPLKKYSPASIIYTIFMNGNDIRKSGSFELPELFQTLIVSPNPSNKVELLDRLTYVETMGLLDSGDIKDYKNAIKMLKRTNFENIVEVDKKEFSESTNGIYDTTMNENEIFDAIRLPFYDKINGINKSIFQLFVDALEDNDKKSYMKKFLSSLTTVKKWKEFTDLKYRATCLKNEIIARLLYGMLKRKDNSLSEQDLIKKIGEEFITLIDILPGITGDAQNVFKDEKYITIMLKIDPYSFDALRSFTDIPSDLECKYWVHARENNYLFTKEETKKYFQQNREAQHPRNEKRLALPYPGVKHSDSNEIHDIREYINNEIGIPKISDKSKSEYLRKVRELARAYIRKNEETDLLIFLKSIDLYMRTNNEYVIQQHDEEKEITVVTMFDKDSAIPKEDRLLYVLYNLNQLAHSTTERNLLYDVHHKYRIDATEEEKEGNILTNLIKHISELMQYGLSFEEILSISEGKRNIDLKVLGEIPASDESLAEHLNDFCIQSEVVIPITAADIVIIKEKFKYLHDNIFMNNRINKVKNYAQERFTFFETKRIIADELIRKFTKEIDGELIEIAFASKEDKQEFYAKHGLIVEIQLDKKEVTKDGVTTTENNPVLVCYSEQFNETFSIHLKELDKKYLDRFNDLVSNNQLVESISNTALKPPGLSLRSSKIRKKQKNSPIPTLDGRFISKKSIDKEKREIDYAVAFFNYFTYDVERIKYQNRKMLNNIRMTLEKESLTPEELVQCRKALEELTYLKDSTYYTRFVDSEKELNEDYEKIFGCKLPADVFGLSSIQAELKLLHQKLLVHLLKQRQETQKSFRV